MLAGESPVVEAFSALGLPTSRVATGKTSVKEVSVLARVLRAHQIDVLLVDRPRDLRLGALASISHRLVIINRYNLSRHNPPSDLISRLAYRRVGMTIFVSSTTAERALRLAPYIRQKPHRVIPGAVDSDHFRPSPGEAEAFRSAHNLGKWPFLLAVGSLTLDKRYDFLLDALAVLGSAAPPLVICGDGSLRPHLESRARELGVEVRFLGFVSPAELPGAYSAATAFVHACAIETFGLSVLEAMSCGRPILAVRGGAVPEVLDATGLLAPSDDPQAYARLLQQLITDQALRTSLGQAARSRAVERFSLAQMQQSYSEAVESAALRLARRARVDEPGIAAPT
jgi:glycosyltransferase involved in cell wall biosynthesis